MNDATCTCIYIPEAINVESLGHFDNDQVGILIVVRELRVLPIRAGGVLSDASGERFPDGPDAVNIGMVGIEDRVSSRPTKVAHVVERHRRIRVTNPSMHSAMGVILKGTRSSSTQITQMVRHPIEQTR